MANAPANPDAEGSAVDTTEAPSSRLRSTFKRRSVPRPTFSRPTFSRPAFSRPTFSKPTVALPTVSLPRVPLPRMSGWTAAATTGVVIGLALVLATAGVLRACDAVRGTQSCGGSGGFVLLLVLVTAAIYVGGLMLRAFDVPDPGSTSFLAVALLVVISMLFFLESILAWWMILLIPLVSAGAYALSHWVTTAFVEPNKETQRDQRVS